MSRAWVNALWQELQEMDDVDQITATGDWITYIGQILLPDLARHRRTTVAEMLEDKEAWNPVKLAETIGARPRTITRLAEDGRKLLRQP